MSDPVVGLAVAEASAVAARRRLQATLAILQARLEPKRLARDTVRDLNEAGTAITRRTSNTARRNPGALAGAVAFAGLILARHRVAMLFRRSREATRDADAS